MSDDEFPLAEDFSKYADILLNDDSFSQSTTHHSTITTSSRISKPKPKTKKHRTKPCINCRKRKTKCLREENDVKCVECVKRDLECVYDTTSTTATPAVTANAVEICDNCTHRRTKCLIQPGSKTCTECSLRDLPCKFTAKDDSVKIRDDTPVLDYDEYNGPTKLRKTLSLQGPKSAQIQSPNSNLEKNLLKFGKDHEEELEQFLSPTSRYLKNEQLIISQKIKLRKINNGSFFKIINDNGEFIKLNHSQVDEIEKIVYPHGFTLINLYFKYIHPLLPIIEKSVIFEKYTRSHKEFDPLILIMIYLHALKLWNHTNLPDTAKPDVDKLERLGIILYSETFINLVPKFSTCQALVLLIHYNPTSQDLKPITNIETKDDKWEKLAKLITMVEELGLNHNSDDWYTIPSWERKLRKLMAWGIIMVDKFQSLLEFKPSKISSNDWILNELNVKDFQEDKKDLRDGNVVEWEDEEPIDDELSMFGNLIFVKMIHLSYHANDCLTEIFNLKSIKFDDFDTLTTKSINLLNNLTNWYDSLPLHLKELKVYSNFISTGSLNLSYQLVNTLIYRRIINFFIDNYYYFSDFDEVLIKFKAIYKRIVKEMIQFNNSFMKKLDIVHLTNCFWYGMKSSSFINIAIVLQLLMKITKLELYIDDEYSFAELKEVWASYNGKLKELSESGDKEVGDVLKHIENYVAQ